jgi:heme-degrading monooxygenase HmoA
VYGTLGRMRVKPGKRDDVVAFMTDPRAAEMPGYRGTHLLLAEEGNEAIVAVMYEDKDAYFAMVHDPRVEENFGHLMELLEGEPEWTDGEWASAPAP